MDVWVGFGREPGERTEMKQREGGNKDDKSGGGETWMNVEDIGWVVYEMHMKRRVQMKKRKKKRSLSTCV